ncbi:MAG: two-component system LytT family response regulator [Polaribacter sp.]|jgi:two-component system LytT family response regulator
MRAIIVDDEMHSQLALKKLLSKNHPDVNVIACGQSVKEGLHLIQELNPDVVFLDVEMPDGLGFDLLQQIDNLSFQVIFITAHNKYAITAIKFGALDYLLKPIPEEELASAILKIKSQLNQQISQDQIKILLETLDGLTSNKLPSRIAIPTSRGTIYKKVKDIIRLEASQNYTYFSILNQDKGIIASLNIGEYIDQFEQYDEFMKVHRSHLINLLFVEKYVKAEGGYIVMKDDGKVSVSKIHKDRLLQRLEAL